MAVIVEKASFSGLLGNVFGGEDIIYIIPASFIVLAFYKNQGILTRIISNKGFVLLGNVSAYTFLIHYAVIVFVSGILGYFDYSFPKYGTVAIEFILTLIGTFLYIKIEGIVKYKFFISK